MQSEPRCDRIEQAHRAGQDVGGGDGGDGGAGGAGGRESQRQETETRPQVEHAPTDEFGGPIVDGREIGCTVEQFAERVAVVGDPRVEGTRHRGTDESHHRQFELVLAELGVLDRGGHLGDEALADLLGREGMRDVEPVVHAPDVQRSGGYAFDRHVVVCPPARAAGSERIEQGHCFATFFGSVAGGGVEGECGSL